MRKRLKESERKKSRSKRRRRKRIDAGGLKLVIL